MTRVRLSDPSQTAGVAVLATVALKDATALVLMAAPTGPKVTDADAAQALRSRTGRGDIGLARRASGRPCLAAPYPELGVSMAHRGRLGMIGFSPTVCVGVDVEIDADQQDLDVVRLAADHYAVGEAAYIAGLTPTLARRAFLRLWVAKEAVLKMTGRGIADGLRLPDLSLGLEAGLGGDARTTIEAAKPIAASIVVETWPAPDGAFVFGALAVQTCAGRP